jgi:agmatinase
VLLAIQKQKHINSKNIKLYYAESDLPEADIIVIGFPYDKTSSFLPGSKYGPEFIRFCSDNIEDYSPYQNKSLYDHKICDLDDISLDNKDWDQTIEKKINEIYDKEKFYVFLGGEHTITVPIIRSLKSIYSEFTVVQFDAHCDMRDQYKGKKMCHASVMRRVSEMLNIENIYQFGIRSGTKEEFSFGKNLYKYEVLKPLASVIDKIHGPVYLTIDVDVLDPGVLPAVSTPEPGGISYRELIDALLLFKDKQIIGADIVEYNPLTASPYGSGSTVAELLRELIIMTRK